MKLKTRKAALKRVIQKKTHFARKCAGKAHFLRRKSAKQLRNLFKYSKIHISDLKTIQQMLPYA
jgi:ribosomal protein L35